MPFNSTTLPRLWRDGVHHREGESAGDAKAVSLDVALSYRRHYQAVRRYSYAILRSLPEAEDVAQESFVRLIQTVGRGTEIENTLPWLLRVAHNLSLSRLGRRPSELPLALDHELLIDAAPNPEEAAVERQRRIWLKGALARLSPQELRCWTLRAEGLRYREIGEILGLRSGTVATLLVRATEKLASACAELNLEPDREAARA